MVQVIKGTISDHIAKTFVQRQRAETLRRSWDVIAGSRAAAAISGAGALGVGAAIPLARLMASAFFRNVLARDFYAAGMPLFVAPRLLATPATYLFGAMAGLIRKGFGLAHMTTFGNIFSLPFSLIAGNAELIAGVAWAASVAYLRCRPWKYREGGGGKGAKGGAGQKRMYYQPEIDQLKKDIETGEKIIKKVNEECKGKSCDPAEVVGLAAKVSETEGNTDVGADLSELATLMQADPEKALSEKTQDALDIIREALLSGDSLNNMTSGDQERTIANAEDAGNATINTGEPGFGDNPVAGDVGAAGAGGGDAAEAGACAAQCADAGGGAAVIAACKKGCKDGGDQRAPGEARPRMTAKPRPCKGKKCKKENTASTWKKTPAAAFTDPEYVKIIKSQITLHKMPKFKANSKGTKKFVKWLRAQPAKSKLKGHHIWQKYQQYSAQPVEEVTVASKRLLPNKPKPKSLNEAIKKRTSSESNRLFEKLTKAFTK